MSEAGELFMRKVKVLIGLFVVMLILSLDLGSIFSETSTEQTKEQNVKQESMFQFANLKHNLGCITFAVKNVVSQKTQSLTTKTADKYANAIANTTTKTVENAISQNQKEEAVKK